MRGESRSGESILIVMQRLTRVLMVIIVFIAALALFGLHVGTASLASVSEDWRSHSPRKNRLRTS